MIATRVTVQIICESCKMSELNINVEDKESYLRTRIIILSKKQENDVEYLKDILFNRELSLRMQPPITGGSTIDMDWLMSKENNIPNNLFFEVDGKYHLCSMCVNNGLNKINMKNKNYAENSDPIDTFDYKGYHIRFYIVGSAIDVSIFDSDATSVLSLYDFKNIGEAKRSAKRSIDEGDL